MQPDRSCDHVGSLFVWRESLPLARVNCCALISPGLAGSLVFYTS